MKKLLVMAIAAFVVLALAACGGDNGTQAASQQSGTAEQDAFSADLDLMQEIFGFSPELRAYLETMNPDDVTPELVVQMATQETRDARRQEREAERTQLEADREFEAEQDEPAADTVSREAGNHAIDFPDSYYTIGQVVNLWGNWELVVHDGARVVPPISENPESFLDARPGIRERAQEIRDAGILIIPATITRTGAPDQPGRRDGVAWLHTSYSVYGPNGEVMDRHSILSVDQSIIGGMRRDFAREDVPLVEPYVFSEVQAGESHTGYIFAIYDGDGDYIIRIRANIFIVVPVSR